MDLAERQFPAIYDGGDLVIARSDLERGSRGLLVYGSASQRSRYREHEDQKQERPEIWAVDGGASDGGRPGAGLRAEEMKEDAGFMLHGGRVCEFDHSVSLR
jgi:hypothetical protein